MRIKHRMQRNPDFFHYLALRTLAVRPLPCSQETENSPVGNLTGKRKKKILNILITGNSPTNALARSPHHRSTVNKLHLHTQSSLDHVQTEAESKELPDSCGEPMKWKSLK